MLMYKVESRILSLDMPSAVSAGGRRKAPPPALVGASWGGAVRERAMPGYGVAVDTPLIRRTVDLYGDVEREAEAGKADTSTRQEAE
jgi:hypothetical protein